MGRFQAKRHLYAYMWAYNFTIDRGELGDINV